MAFRDGPFENLKVPLAWTAAVVVVVGIIGAVFYSRWATQRQLATGVRPPVLLVNIALVHQSLIDGF